MKKRISLILSITLSFSLFFSVPVNATINGDDGSFINNTLDWMRRLAELGCLMETPEYPTLDEYMQQYQQNNPASTVPDGETPQDFYNWINNGTIISGNNISYDNDTFGFMKYVCQQEVSKHEYVIGYGYKFYFNQENRPAEQAWTSFSNNSLVTQWASTLYKWDPDTTYFRYVQDYSTDAYYFTVRSTESDNAWGKAIQSLRYPSLEIEPNQSTGESFQTNLFCANFVGDYYSRFNSPANMTGSDQRLVDYQDRAFYLWKYVPKNPYTPSVITTDSYNSNMTKDSYNTTTTNIDNSVTYGDVVNYINDTKQSTGVAPSPVEVNVYVNNYVPGGEGGSGEGGEGGSGSGDSEGIFDFLSKIGEVLGNLIKNLGNILADIIDGISEILNTIFGSFTNIFNPLISFVFGGLPEELQNLITLGVTAAILVGLINLIRK